MTIEEKYQKVKTALEGILGVDENTNLEEFEATLRATPGVEQDKIVAINAVHALQEVWKYQKSLEEIPKMFYRGDDHPEAQTVGELKMHLNDLPDDLPIHNGFNDGVMLIVFNHGKSDMHLGLEEIDE
jgi:hypothetical protein